jgi:hypothetical protein
MKRAAEPGASQDRVPFVEGLRLDYGRVPQIARFLLQADAFVYRAGIALAFEPLPALAELNAAQFETWGRFAPQLDTRIAPVPAGSSYCLIGRNGEGKIVAAQAGRVYEAGPKTLFDIAVDRSMYYGELEPPPNGITCELTAPGAQVISGTFVYSGGLWVHPDYRGHRLAAILPRVSRCIALGRWNTSFTHAFIGEKMANSPLLQFYGYKRVEPSYTFYEDGRPIYTGLLMWMDRDELIDDVEQFTRHQLPALDASLRSGHR